MAKEKLETALKERTIERTPLKVSKWLIVQCLQNHPEDLADICPGFDGTAEEAIEWLKAQKGTWFVNGELVEELPKE